MFDKDFYEKMVEMHSDVKHVVKWLEAHDKEDDARFETTNKKVEFVTKTVYMGIGGLVVIQILITLIK